MKEKFWEKYRVFVKPFLILFAIYLIGISAILIANVHYADDAARTNYGYAGWSAFSRYTSTTLSYAVHTDGFLTNIAPLPQLLAVMILTVTSLILIALVSGRTAFEGSISKWIWKLVAVVPLVLSPYMLECLSYQYDAVYMALSVFFAVMPLMFYRRKKWQFVLASVVGILGVCTTYQASIGIYPMLVVFLMAKDWNNKTLKGKEIIKNGVMAAAVFLVTLVFFQKVLMQVQDIYVSNEVPAVGDLIPAMITHLKTYFELLMQDFRRAWKLLVIAIVVLYVGFYTMKSKRNKILAAMVGIISVGLMGISMYILYAVLEKPLYATRAMYAVGALIAIMGVYVVSAIPEVVKLKAKKKRSNKQVGAETQAETRKQYVVWASRIVLAAPVVVMAWCFFVFGFTYGNALGEQNTFRNMQTDMVIADLNNLLTDGKKRKIQTIGQIGFAPSVEHTPMGKYHILRRLLKPSFESNVPWMTYRLKEASGLSVLEYDPHYVGTTAITEMSVLKDTVFYTIYGNDEGIVVKFKGQEYKIWEG